MTIPIEMLRLGLRVRLVRDMNVFNVGNFPADAAGVVSAIDPEAPEGCPIAHVRLDAHFEDLDYWDNQLQIFRAADACAEITEEGFELEVPLKPPSL
jgi:hypothetical protein